MKKVICLLLVMVMSFTVFTTPVVATEVALQEDYSTEELLAMDQTLDSDGDGVTDVYEIIFGADRYKTDTDGDGVSDYVEIFVTGSEVCVPDGELDTDGDGITNVQECVYGTNADDRDSDNDNLLDAYEIDIGTSPIAKDTDGDGLRDDIELALEFDPLNDRTDGVTVDSLRREAIVYLANNEPISAGQLVDPMDPGSSTFAVIDPITPVGPGDGGTMTYQVALHTEFGSSSVSYQYKDYWFFEDNTEYNVELAKLSALLSAIAYDSSYLSYTSAANSADAISDWFSQHFYSNYANYDLHDEYNDQHVSEMFVARTTYTSGGETKNIICVVIRGTNETLDEWQSNFDVGSTDDFSSYSEWTKSSNHMGFDITANRLNAKLDEYISAYCAGRENILWITGHSRGAALANILASKRVDTEDVFAYTFAAPATTTYTIAEVASKYQCIFNIVNPDDFVTKLPLESWNFKRYGQTLDTVSIEDSCASEWDVLMGGDVTYNCSRTLMDDTIDAFEGIASNRNNCYQYVENETGYYTDSNLHTTVEGATRAAEQDLTCRPPNISGTCRYSIVASGLLYRYRVYQKPSFFMQLLAAQKGGEMTALGIATVELAPYLRNARQKLVSFGLWGEMAHPHYPQSYYLLSDKYS